MSSRLIGILLIVSLLMIFLVIGAKYKESFYELEEDIIKRCGNNPYEYLKNNVPGGYYWAPRTIMAYHSNMNINNPIHAIIGYEWNKCTGGSLIWDPEDVNGYIGAQNWIPVWFGIMMMTEIPRVLLNDSFNRQLITERIDSNYINFQLNSPNNIVIIQPGTYRLVVKSFNLANPSPVNIAVTIIKQGIRRNSSTITAPGVITLESLDKDDQLQIIFKGPSSDIIILSNPNQYQFKLEFSTRGDGDGSGGGGGGSGKDDDDGKIEEDSEGRWMPVFRKKYKNNNPIRAYYSGNTGGEKYTPCSSTASNTYITCSTTSGIDLIIKKAGIYKITSSISDSTITITPPPGASYGSRTLNINDKTTGVNKITFEARVNDRIYINKSTPSINAKFVMRYKL